MTIKVEDIPKAELFGQGHVGCKACGAAIAGRQVMKVLGKRTIVTIPASCFATLSANNSRSSWHTPYYHTLFESAAAVSSGIRAALKAQGINDVNVISWGGDAGSADIGFQALTGAAERDENIVHICYDNEMYMNTGGQTGSQTPQYGLTSNTQLGKPTRKKNMLAIMEAHGVGYVASANIAFPEDLMEKVAKASARAREGRGFSYIHILTPCLRGWGIEGSQTIDIARKATECGLFELYEVENGQKTRTYEPAFISVENYLKPQARFRKLTAEQIHEIQNSVYRYYSREE